jgi:hypothetical protein
MKRFGSSIKSCISKFIVSKPLRHTEVRDKSLNGVIIYATIYIQKRNHNFIASVARISKAKPVPR